MQTYMDFPKETQKCLASNQMKENAKNCPISIARVMLKINKIISFFNYLISFIEFFKVRSVKLTGIYLRLVCGAGIKH